MNKYDKRHIANVRRYQRQVDAIYKEAVEQAALRAAGLPVPEDYIFTFDDFPALKMQIDALMSKMQADLEMTMTNGIRTEWDLANAKNDALVSSALGQAAGLARYNRTHEDALSAFLARKERGLNLSDRVWQYTKQFKGELEMGLDLGIREGMDAASMARQLKQYLQFPDMLFRRVRDEHGVLHLSKRAAEFHPGQGVYRSSYKNARRLAATETNIAYRTSDHERWKDLDFIVGIEIHLSNNHTCLNNKGKPVAFFDICDELQGKYPKEFKFVGWHPHCRCIATPILKTKAELDADDERIKRGEEPIDPNESENAVKELPDQFKTWMDDNAERIENAKSTPYFLADNEALISGTPAAPAQFQTEHESNVVFDKLNIPQLPDFVPDFSKMSYEEKVNNIADAMTALDPDTYKRYAELSKRAAELGDAERVWKSRFNFDLYTSPDNIRRLETINHLKELATADLSAIPPQWQGKMAELIKQINAHDIAVNGFKAIYAECEHAYNIYKLSTTQEAIDFGLAKLSDKTPYNLFTVVRKKIPNFAIPEKEFMDRFDKFVPLSTRAKSGSGAYYQPFYGNVCIPVELRKYAGRLKASKWYAEGGIFHHEFGHALDWQIGIKTDQKLVTIYDAFKAEIQKDGTAAFEKKINDILDKRMDELGEAWRGSKEYAKLNGAVNNAKTIEEWDKAFAARKKGREKFFTAHGYDDLEEMLGAFSDCLGAATDGTCAQRPRGHFGGYFKSRENQLAEFVAHCSENYWSGNPYFEKLAPQLYKAMRDYFAGLY